MKPAKLQAESFTHRVVGKLQYQVKVLVVLTGVGTRTSCALSYREQ